ncbi:MAG TPA: ScpA family protein [Candidatus Paceibacterota bacterium]|nr:ScpA family protein [Candidatus Paceibacterota bacterium]
MTDQQTAFLVRHEKFEGPLEVLLELVEKRKLFVNDISLASVTDDYLSYIQQKKVPAEQVAGFVAVAATLILIKARSLLPNLELSPEEAQSIEELEYRLKLYQLISAVAPKLIVLYGKKPIYLPRVKVEMVVFAPDPTLGLERLPELIKSILGRVPKEVVEPKKPEAVVYKTISISEVLGSLTDRIMAAAQTTFSNIAVASPDKDEKSQKVYTIVSFLGMLELVRRGFIDAEQPELFEEISIQKLEAEVVVPDLEETHE